MEIGFDQKILSKVDHVRWFVVDVDRPRNDLWRRGAEMDDAVVGTVERTVGRRIE